MMMESAWKIKWWANCQFTFLLSVAEVNAGMARARAKKAPAKPMLDFWRQLTKMMLENRFQFTLGGSQTPPMSSKRGKGTRGNMIPSVACSSE
jgi:hypothetical protein